MRTGVEVDDISELFTRFQATGDQAAKIEIGRILSEVRGSMGKNWKQWCTLLPFNPGYTELFIWAYEDRKLPKANAARPAPTPAKVGPAIPATPKAAAPGLTVTPEMLRLRAKVETEYQARVKKMAEQKNTRAEAVKRLEKSDNHLDRALALVLKKEGKVEPWASDDEKVMGEVIGLAEKKHYNFSKMTRQQIYEEYRGILMAPQKNGGLSLYDDVLSRG